jgi:hypothetical protein
MIGGKASILQKPRLPGLFGPTVRLRETKATNAQFACALAPICAGAQSGLDQFLRDAALREVTPDAYRPLTPLGMERHELHGVALIIDVTAFREFIDYELRGGELKALCDKALQQLIRTEVASAEQRYRGRAGHRGIGTFARCDAMLRRSFPQHAWAVAA